MGSVYNGIHRELALKLKKVNGARAFVETGTYMGNTAEWAAKQFGKVYTIEAELKFYNKAGKKLKEANNVQAIFANSYDGLITIKHKVKDNAVFWLDAHYSRSDSYNIGKECPVLEELSVVNDFEGDNIIMIDDARYFLSPPPAPWHYKEWPDVWDIFWKQIKAMNMVYVIDDVILSVPLKYRESVEWILKTYKEERNEK